MKYLKLFTDHAAYLQFTQTQDFILPNVSRCLTLLDVHYNPIPDPRLIVTYKVTDDGGGEEPAENVNSPKGGTRTVSTVQAKIFNYWDVNEYEQYGNTSPFSSDIKASDIFDRIELEDGTEIDPADVDEAYGYIELTPGTHVIKYTLTDPTTIPEGLFANSGNGGGGGSIAAKGETRNLGQQVVITKVEIPNSVETIETLAFMNCSDLITIKFGTGIEAIENYAFCGCGINQFDNATLQAFQEFALNEILSENAFGCPNNGVPEA